MEIGLKGKVALVTGTGSQIGFGKAIALTLAKEGCDIISTDIDFEGAKKTADAVKALGRKALAFKTDVTNKAEVDNMVRSAEKEFGKIDILVNSAGGRAGRGPILKSTEETWKKDMALNLYGSIFCCQAVIPGMIERKSGKVINITSGGARSGGDSYSQAKAGVIALTKGLANEVGGFGINVNAVAPGPAQTNFAGGRPGGGYVEEWVKQRTQTYPLKRMTTADDIAGAVAFLASNWSDGVAGDTVAVGGSYLM